MHKHLQRLSRIYPSHPQYFITACTHLRRSILNSGEVVQILRDEWHTALERHGWVIGRYVIMPDHAHFFCAEQISGKSLAAFVGAWKEWTSKRLARELGLTSPIWQAEFFDHVLRSDESFAEKWDYVRQNPVRAGLVNHWADWPYQGSIHYDAHWTEEPASPRPATGGSLQATAAAVAGGDDPGNQGADCISEPASPRPATAGAATPAETSRHSVDHE